MKHLYALIAIAALFLAACDENTGTLGISADMDQVSNTTSNFTVSTRSILMDKGILANNTNCYLGHVTDPETGCEIEADFAVQYQTFENYAFPDKELMVDATDTNNIKHGVPLCDSCDVRLFFDKSYGLGNNPMKMQVYELSSDPDKMLSEDSLYYTDVDLTQFLPENAKPLASRMFTPTDYDLTVDDRADEDYRSNIRISIPASFGQKILGKYYENPENFKDSYHFTHNVLPGMYFRCADGNGTMIKVYAGLINLYFKYQDEKTDSIVSGMARFAATPEVIQSTRFRNSEGMKALADIQDYTYLKTPAGIATEMTLPIDEIFGGEHATDSVSKASITITRYNKEQTDGQLSTPQELLMLRKCEMDSFFKKRAVSNGRTSYTTTFSSTYNSYSYNNISRLLSYCMHEKIDAVRKRLEDKGLSHYTDAQFKAEEQQWMQENPDWNKVVLIPIVTSTTSITSQYGTQTLEVSVNHDMGLNSVRLVGGKTPLQLQVVYSRFE